MTLIFAIYFLIGLVVTIAIIAYDVIESKIKNGYADTTGLGVSLIILHSLFWPVNLGWFIYSIFSNIFHTTDNK